jgi:hypothetical protein
VARAVLPPAIKILVVKNRDLSHIRTRKLSLKSHFVARYSKLTPLLEASDFIKTLVLSNRALTEVFG